MFLPVQIPTAIEHDRQDAYTAPPSRAGSKRALRIRSSYSQAARSRTPCVAAGSPPPGRSPLHLADVAPVLSPPAGISPGSGGVGTKRPPYWPAHAGRLEPLG